MSIQKFDRSVGDRLTPRGASLVPASGDGRAHDPPQRKGSRSQRRACGTPNDARGRMSEKPLLTVRSAGLRLNCSPRTIWRYIRDGELPVIRFGRATRITEDDLLAFIDRHKVKSRGES